MKYPDDALLENVRYSYPEYSAYIEVLSVKRFRRGLPAMHWHDDVEFLLILSGGDDYTVNGEKIPLTAGEGIFVNARQMHYGTPTENSRALCVRLNPRVLCMSPYFETTYVLPVTENTNMPYVKLSPDTEWQKNLMNGLREMYRTCESPSAPLHIHGLFCFVWSLLSDNMPDCSRTDRSSDDLTAIETMIEFIESNYARKLTLAQIAEAGHVCESKCCRLFNRYVHKTPNAYLVQYRLGKAAELLVSTDDSVTEIAFACGFSGASYFTELFRKSFGSTPKEYRETNRK